MKLNLESTTKIIELNGTPARIWEGTTESGIKIHAFIHRVAVDKNEAPDALQKFRDELLECKAPSPEIEIYPLRMIL